MDMARLMARWQMGNPWLLTAAFVWGVLLLAVCLRSGWQPYRQTTYPIWEATGRAWLQGQDLYGELKDGQEQFLYYRYSPLIAALFTPCAMLPLWLGGVLWRLLSAVALLLATDWWLRQGCPWQTTPTQRGVIYLLMAPLALGSLNNAQANIALLALMLVNVTAVQQQRWTLSALALALAIHLKVYPIALAGLLVLLYPLQLGSRLVLALLVLTVLPFGLQQPEYVARQYKLWWGVLAHGDAVRRTWSLVHGYRDVWQLLSAWQVPITLFQYTLLQLAGGAGCAVAVLLARWRLGRGTTTLWLTLTFATCWMLVLGPSPESCTYGLIAPMLAYWIACLDRRPERLSYALGLCGYGLLVLCVLAGTSSTGIRLYQGTGLQPLGVLLFALGVAGAATSWLLWPEAVHETTPQVVGAAIPCAAQQLAA